MYDNLVESLHVLFTLYLEFKNNPYFNVSDQYQPDENTNTLSFGVDMSPGQN